VVIEFTFHVRRIDVGGVFDGNFDRVEPPALEPLEKFGALVGEGEGRERY
jgi:hypothetical protein